jgi:hypothetical protein
MAKVKTQLSNGFKQKWAQALRSSNYAQGIGLMYNSKENTYDPIGVAYRVCGVPLEKIKNQAYPSGEYYRFLPRDLYENDELIGKITDFADKGLSFKWIASYIERNL